MTTHQASPSDHRQPLVSGDEHFTSASACSLWTTSSQTAIGDGEEPQGDTSPSHRGRLPTKHRQLSIEHCQQLRSSDGHSGKCWRSVNDSKSTAVENAEEHPVTMNCLLQQPTFHQASPAEQYRGFPAATSFTASPCGLCITSSHTAISDGRGTIGSDHWQRYARRLVPKLAYPHHLF